MIMLYKKEGKYISVLIHYMKSFFGLGIAGERFTGCDDKHSETYKCCNIKIYFGSFIINLSLRGRSYKVTPQEGS